MSRLAKEIIIVLLFKLIFLVTAKFIWFSHPPEIDPHPAYLTKDINHD